MKFISSAHELRAEFQRLLRDSVYFDWAVAWASVNFPGFDSLKKYQRKARRIVVGTHFYQTHPDFIGEFAANPAIRFVLQPDGVFHPKVYFFEIGRENWVCIVGSANFTQSAFSENSEAVVCFDSNEPNAGDLRAEIIGEIQLAWNQGKTITSDELQAYRALWQRYRPVRKKLAGQFGKAPGGKAATQTHLFRYDWAAYVAKLPADAHHDFSKRLDVLAAIRAYFATGKPFSSFTEEQRRRVAGFASDDTLPWRYFGSMKGAGRFKNAIIRNDQNLSSALDEISLSGQITKDDYDAYIEKFTKAFPEGGDGIATATRLLAMKRPDSFVCVDNKNIEQLAKDFDIPKYRLNSDYSAYWNEVIERVQETGWWNAPRPRTKSEQPIWDGRTALMDAIYYKPS